MRAFAKPSPNSSAASAPASQATSSASVRVPRSERADSGRFPARRDDPFTRSALGFGDLARSHLLGNVGATQLRRLVTGDRGKIEPLVRFDEIARYAMAASGKSDTEIEIGTDAPAGRCGEASRHQHLAGRV